MSSSPTVTVLGHLPQFVIAPDIFSNPSSTKLKIFEREMPKFNQEDFILDYLSVDWENFIESNNRNVDQSSVSFLTKLNSILDLFVPLKKISKQKLQFRNKP